MTSYDLSRDYSITNYENYNDGDIIFNEGTPGDWIYVILKGKIEIFKNIRGKKIVVDVLQEGDLFGEVSFIDKNPRSAGARAVGQVTLGLFDKEFLTQQYNKLPNNFRVIFDAMARRLRKMTAVATNLAGRRAERTAQTIEIRFDTHEDFKKAYSTNIGEGGLFIQTDQLIEVGREVNLVFSLPGESRPIHARGKVTWHRREGRQGIGIQFTGLDPNDHRKLKTYVDRHLR